MQTILRELEKEFNLTQVASSWETDRRSPTHGQTQRYKKEKKEYEAGERDAPPELPVSEKLQDLIDAATSDQPTMSQFVSRLQQQGVEVRPKITRNNIVQGISYCLDGVKFPGSKLGNASFPKLQSKRGVEYDPERDLAALKQAAAGEMVEVVGIEAEEVGGQLKPTVASVSAKKSQKWSHSKTTGSGNGENIQSQSEIVREVAAIVNALLYLRETNYLEGTKFTAKRQNGILQLWEKGNEQPILKASADKETKTWKDTGESKLTPEIVNHFTEHLSPVLEQARALREQKRKQKRSSQKHSLRKRKQKQGGLEL
ncbi:MAG: hypothetical protein SAL07_23825 [Oscillatoria sp. PMC 1051.18]|nr:hypothetical protein [Oscillatoria sp. PMC 1050.18]MEC5032942.1 hypothetical protein [Oscillatoria sp. PMC 1051.18]